jgi:SAM-dependent methyltransferase
MFLAWLKFILSGYSTPTPFSATNEEQSAKHAKEIVSDWLIFLKDYAGESFWKEADVVELGPGPNLATGALLLAEGARSYRAVDVFPLVAEASPDFYARVLSASEPARRQEIINAIVNHDDSLIAYSVVPEFKVDDAVGSRKFDLLVSCAAFEHFDDILDTIARTTRVAKPNAVFCAAIDFQTHSRWIRDKDPNNIYRYSDWLYDLLKFPSKPNRKRPDDFVRALRAAGWENVQFKPQDRTTTSYQQATKNWLNRKFRSPDSAMDVLNGTMLATFPGLQN